VTILVIVQGGLELVLFRPPKSDLKDRINMGDIGIHRKPKT
jgi:hypothetical protein